jgi:hypothetical protein
MDGDLEEGLANGTIQSMILHAWGLAFQSEAQRQKAAANGIFHSH